MDNKILFAIVCGFVVVIAIILIIVFVSPKSAKEKDVVNAAASGASDGVLASGGTTAQASSAANSAAAAVSYTFHRGMDSDGNDISNSGLADKIQELKDWCTASAECKGFNTNAWMKKIIRPATEWVRWTDDPVKGLYVKNV